MGCLEGGGEGGKMEGRRGKEGREGEGGKEEGGRERGEGGGRYDLVLVYRRSS